MDRLVDTGDPAPGQDVGAGRHPHATGQDSGEVGKDVAEQVAGEQDVERRGCLDHAGSHGIDQDDLQLDGRVLLRDFTNNLVPQRIAVAHGVRLGDQCEPTGALGGKREGVLGGPLDRSP